VNAGIRVAASVAALTLTACSRPTAEPEAEISFHYQGGNVVLMRDQRTSCEYFINGNGGIILRVDPRGNVTPNCAASRNYQPLVR